MIILILGLFCFCSTLTIMILRYGNSMLYELLKQVQLFTIAKVGRADKIDLQPAKIETRRDLVDYFEKYVPVNFFYDEDVFDKIDTMSNGEKEYYSPLLQRNMEIIG